MAKGPEAFRSISEASDALGVPQHVLRFWETKFSFIRPMKRAGGRRFYRPQDIVVLAEVRRLLHEEGYTIKGVQKLFKEQGVQALSTVAEPAPVPDAAEDAGPDAAASKVAEDDLAALRAALAEIVDAERILAQARSPGP